MLTQTTADQPKTIDLNPGAALERIDAWLDGAVRLLPNFIVALLVVAAFYVLANLARKVIRSRATKRDRENLGDMLGGFVRWTLLIVGALLGLTIVAPSLKPGDLIAGLGVSSVAIGFAFKDILQNWLAGLLILLRQPFEVHDQIKINDFEGTVERIETRATLIRTYNGQRVVIPNSEIYTNAVVVKTAYDKRRSQYDVGIGYADGIDVACETLRAALENVDGVEADPGVQVFPWDLAASWVTIRLRWWTDTRRTDIVQVRSSVIKAIKEALDRESIDMPYETRVQLFHDQTEASDGDRSKQREGWPSESDDGTKPRWRAESESSRELAKS